MDCVIVNTPVDVQLERFVRAQCTIYELGCLTHGALHLPARISAWREEQEKLRVKCCSISGSVDGCADVVVSSASWGHKRSCVIDFNIAEIINALQVERDPVTGTLRKVR